MEFYYTEEGEGDCKGYIRSNSPPSFWLVGNCSSVAPRTCVWQRGMQVLVPSQRSNPTRNRNRWSPSRSRLARPIGSTAWSSIQNCPLRDCSQPDWLILRRLSKNPPRRWPFRLKIINSLFSNRRKEYIRIVSKSVWIEQEMKMSMARMVSWILENKMKQGGEGSRITLKI